MNVLNTMCITPRERERERENIMTDTTYEWHRTNYDSDYDSDMWYRETNDPRIIEVIQRDTEPQAPDGDMFAPAYWLRYHMNWTVDPAGDTYRDDNVAEAYRGARDRYYKNPEAVERYMRLYWDTYVLTIEDYYRTDAELVILDTPDWREHVGISDPATADIHARYPDHLKGDRETWQAYLDGDVWGVGHLVNPDRVLHGDPDDIDPDDGTWDSPEPFAWGHYGEDLAKESCYLFDLPALNPLLPLT